jgi:diaminohydroxyphosphoribosylaminopyrimidine deaminase/5-amino-6-(5-phosphoribosylamino)uracil reductase
LLNISVLSPRNLPSAEKDLSLLCQAATLSLTSSGETQPHPNAACILTEPFGDIVAEAYLLAQGTQAPEIAATLAAQGRAQGGTAYLNLETGDCHGDTSAIKVLISSGVRRVVIGLRHPVIALRGIAIDALHAAGITVSVLSESPCSASSELLEATDSAVLHANEHLLHVTALNRPLGIVKYAMTLDGKIAASSGHSAWVSGTESRKKVFETRAMSDAVIVGGQTLRRDDPKLTTRREGGHQPLRVVMSRTLDLPLGAALWDTTHAPTIVATQRGVRKEFQRMLRSRGVEVLEFDFLSPAVLADYCRERGHLRLLWECGGTLAAPAIAGGAVHKVMAFVAPKIIGGTKAPTPVGDLGFVEMTQALPLQEVQWSITGQDLMMSGYLPVSGGPKALAAALGLRRPNIEASSNTVHDIATTNNGRASGPSHHFSSNIKSPTSSSHQPVAGFYKNWERFGCFSNFSPHPIIMPDTPMTQSTLETFHPRPGAPPTASGMPNTRSREWKTSEHYYQAQKFAGVDHPEAKALVESIFSAASPEVAAALGRRNERDRPELLRENWEQSKPAVMQAAVRAKFAAHEGPRHLLLSPELKSVIIVETAPHDYFWGQGFDGSGHNMLGKLLMKVRDEFHSEIIQEEGSSGSEKSQNKSFLEVH